jgi:DNA-binding MarR family transcriptional regulator
VILHDQHAHRILTELESDGRASQRSLSREVGIALGLTNLLVRKLVSKGWVRVIHVRPNRVRYLLTPAGIAEKVRLSRQALQNNVRFYAEARDRIAERFAQLSAELAVQASVAWPIETGFAGAGAAPNKRVVFYGGGEVAEIGYICLHRTDLRLVGLVDDAATQFFGVPVYPREQLRMDGVAGTPYESVIVMSFGDLDEIRRTLKGQKIPAERITWL